jgi:dienelactone hydrolase
MQSTIALLLLLLTTVSARAQDPRPPAKPAPAPQKPAENAAKETFETITHKLSDGIVMTGDLYRAPDGATKPVLVCMHMTASSRGEYRPIAPRIVAMGVNVLAVDLRCGGEGEVANRRTKERTGTMNETWKMATEQKKPTAYLDAYPDVVQAVAWAHELFPSSRVGLMGSSYSASFALVFGAEHGDEVDAVLAYSPGEYMKPWSIADKVKKLDVPAFITCGNTDADVNQAKPVAAAIEKKERVHAFWPEDEHLIGDHGSHALMLKGDNPSTQRQWAELEKALEPLKKPLSAADIEKRKHPSK